MAQTILITGGTGTVGTQLKSLLKSQGNVVKILSRKSDPEKGIYAWDIGRKYIDPMAWEGVTSVIHLAGAGVAEKRWTDARKKEIIDSRVASTRLLFDQIYEKKIALDSFVSASAIGIYGFDTGDILLDESSPKGNGFLSDVTAEWEKEVNKISTLGIRTVLVRIGIVLSPEGGALVEMAKPIKFGVGAPLGSGKQWLSWIHIDDLCKLFLFAVENASVNGPVNAVAPEPVTNEVFMSTLAKSLHKPFFLPKVPAFIMNLLVGEMAQMILGGNKVLTEKAIQQGYKYKFGSLKEALNDLVQKMK